MALGDSYATLAELKSRLGITDTNDDTKLTDALSTASRWIEKHCRRQFNDAGSTSARTFNTGGHGIRARVDDFNTTTGLVIQTDADDDGTYETTWATTQYELSPANGIQDGMSGWPYWRIKAVDVTYFPNTRHRGLQVTARWGWTAVPAPVKEATLSIAEETFKMKDAPFGVAGFGEFGAIRVKDNPRACKLVQPYRRDVVRVA